MNKDVGKRGENIDGGICKGAQSGTVAADKQIIRESCQLVNCYKQQVHEAIAGQLYILDKCVWVKRRWMSGRQINQIREEPLFRAREQLKDVRTVPAFARNRAAANENHKGRDQTNVHDHAQSYKDDKQE